MQNNKELKFKIWDTKDDVWRTPFGEIWDFQEMILSDRFVVCQYTGLKDINDVEIYEGDFVKLIKHNIIEQVVYSKDRFRVTNYAGYTDDLSMYCNMQSIKVIGNIFDNKISN